MTTTRLAPGEAAEREAASALEARGWRILDRRLRVGRLEIDLVARLDDVIAIVEVRGRRDGGWQEPLDTIDVRKRARLVAATRLLWSRRFASDASIRALRIDLVAVTWRPSLPPLVEIVEGAIALDEA